MMKTTIYGLPLNPQHLLNELAGQSFCVSYGTRSKLGKQLDQAIDLVGTDGILLVDNGAYTMFKQGKTTKGDAAYQDAFEAWAQDIMDRCPQAVAVVPDVIGGSLEDNLQLIHEWGLDWNRSMAIWHMDESLEHLIYLCESFNYIGIGSSGDYVQTGTPEWHTRMTEAMSAISKWEAESEGCYIRPRIHLMRAQKEAHKYEVDSSDSTNIAMNHGRHKHTGPGHVGREAARVNARIQKSAGPEAEHQAKRPLLFHLEAAELEAAARLDMLKDYYNSKPKAEPHPLDIPEFLRRAA